MSVLGASSVRDDVQMNSEISRRCTSKLFRGLPDLECFRTRGKIQRPSRLSLREIPFLFVCFLCLGLAFLLLFAFLDVFLMGFLFRGSKSRNFGFSTDDTFGVDVSRQMRFLEERFFQNLKNQDMSTTEGFASVRECDIT